MKGIVNSLYVCGIQREAEKVEFYLKCCPIIVKIKDLIKYMYKKVSYSVRNNVWHFVVADQILTIHVQSMKNLL